MVGVHSKGMNHWLDFKPCEVACVMVIDELYISGVAGNFIEVDPTYNPHFY